jgi:hypothetical protein
VGFPDGYPESGFLQICGNLLTRLGIFGKLLLWEKVSPKKGIPRHQIRFNSGDDNPEISIF